MILSYSTHKKMVMKDAGLSIIATKSPIAYRDIVEGLLQKNERLLFCDDNYQSKEIGKAFDFVGDPVLSGDVTAKYMTSIINKLVADLDAPSRDKLLKAYSQLESLLQDTLFMADLPLKINFSQDLKKLLKLEKVQLDSDFVNSPYDIIETILRIHQECGMDSIPVFCNVSHYLEGDAVAELSSLCLQMKLKLIFIEFSGRDFLIVPQNAKCFYIDEDLVDWY